MVIASEQNICINSKERVIRYIVYTLAYIIASYRQLMGSLLITLNYMSLPCKLYLS